MNVKVKSLLKFSLIFLTSLILLAFVNIHNELNADIFYVAPDGSDENIGSKSRPFKTITKARDAARKVRLDKARKIVLRGGLYYEVEIILGSEDSGLTIEAAPGERPVLPGWVSFPNRGCLADKL